MDKVVPYAAASVGGNNDFRYSTCGVRSSAVDEQSQFIARTNQLEPEDASNGRHSPSSTSPSTPAVVPWRVHHGGGVRCSGPGITKWCCEIRQVLRLIFGKL